MTFTFHFRPVKYTFTFSLSTKQSAEFKLNQQGASDPTGHVTQEEAASRTAAPVVRELLVVQRLQPLSETDVTSVINHHGVLQRS